MSQRAKARAALNRQALCDGKDPLTRDLAKRISRRMNLRKGGGGSSIYRCPVCDQGHVGVRTKK